MAKEKNSSDKSAPKKTAAKKSPAKKAAAAEIASAAAASASPPSGAPAGRAQPSSAAQMYEEIRRRAFELYCQRGGQHGSHEADWHRAELEVRSKYK